MSTPALCSLKQGNVYDIFHDSANLHNNLHDVILRQSPQVYFYCNLHDTGHNLHTHFYHLFFHWSAPECVEIVSSTQTISVNGLLRNKRFVLLLFYFICNFYSLIMNKPPSHPSHHYNNRFYPDPSDFMHNCSVQPCSTVPA